MLDPDLLEDRDLALYALAGHLRLGQLCLVVGAGISVASGIPLWPDFVRRCCASAGVERCEDNASSVEHCLELMERVKEAADSGEKYKQWISAALYRDVEFPGDVIRDPLLIAIDALLMGSTRGSISQVLTYNIDDILERDLHLHGFAALPVP